MEAWLSELEMELNEAPNLSNSLNEEELYYEQKEDMDKLSEDLTAVLGEDFSFSDFNAKTTQNPTNNVLLGQCDQQLPSFSDNINNVIPTYDYSPMSIEPIMANHNQQIHDQRPHVSNNTGDKNSSGVSSDEHSPKSSLRKRRRDPAKVHCHIMAERKRRELLSQRFIALSAMVPGLKKIDKTSILEEAIKHLHQMQERVKVLEEATSKQVTESNIVVMREQLVMNKDNTENVNDSNTLSGGSEDADNNQRNELPEIEVKLTSKTLLLKICCVRRKGVLGKIFQEVEIRGMIVLNSNIMPFESSTLDITILAKVENAEGYDKQVKDLLRTLHSTLQVT